MLTYLIIFIFQQIFLVTFGAYIVIFRILNLVRNPTLTLAILALILAYLAYVKSVRDKYDSWRELFQSFLYELHTAESWLRHARADDDLEKDFFDPGKQVLPLTSVTSEEILRKGISDSKTVPSLFIDKLALFVERVRAFNAAIDRSAQISTANPTLSQSLLINLRKCGMYDRSINLQVFQKNVKSKVRNKSELSLLDQVIDINKVIHNQLISGPHREDRLNYLYVYLQEEAKKIQDKLKSNEALPWYIRNPKTVLAIFILLLTLFYS